MRIRRRHRHHDHDAPMLIHACPLCVAEQGFGADAGMPFTGYGGGRFVIVHAAHRAELERVGFTYFEYDDDPFADIICAHVLARMNEEEGDDAQE
jgi:hypothetical protein